ncbi:MAG: triose-phosphate isomerase [Mycobacteriales bacterium]
MSDRAKSSGTAKRTRRPLVAGNWKMHRTHVEAIALVQQLAFALRAEDTADVDVVVLPPFTAIRSVQTCVDGDHLPIRYGGQDLAVAAEGAHTGDVSGPMLAALGCTSVVVGHSERRADHHEDDALVRAKVVAAYDAGLTPILCVGETLEVRRAGDHTEHCVAQIRAATEDLPPDRASSLVVAYEPIWAIGTGETATAEDAQDMAAALRAAIADRYGRDLARGTRVVYGGSVKPDNATELFAGADVDGGLIGGASLDADAFVRIVRAAAPRS